MIASNPLDPPHIALAQSIVPVRAHFTQSHTEGMRELTLVQRKLLDGWLDDWEVLADLSWPLQDTAVLDVRSGGRRYIVKASRASRHIAREIDAHDQFLRRFSVWVPQLAHSSRDELILVTHYLPGELVEGTDAEVDPEIYRQAGCRLKQLLVPGPLSEDYIQRLVTDVSVSIRPVALSFTHGDYQPRNWLVNDGQLRVIDFGRADQRHWTSELVRLANQQFAGRPHLECAFLEGLDRPMTAQDSEIYRLECIQQALGTVVWANSISDSAFEEHGRRMVRAVLTDG
jgi:hypothetical protein